MHQFPKKENNPNFSDPAIQQAYVQDIKTSKELMQKELEVNRGEQNILTKRIALMKSFVNDIPSSDPHYSMMITQINMDQIEIDELKFREILLTQKLSE